MTDNRNKLMGATMASAALLLAVSCSQDEALNRGILPADGRITFSVGLSDIAVVTRAAAQASETPIALEGDGRALWLVPSVSATADQERSTRGTQLGRSDKLSSFGVSAFRHKSADADLSDNQPDFFYNLEATEVGETGVYQVSQPYYWPASDESLTFNAYYPYGNENVKLTDLNAATKNAGQQSFTVEVAQDGKEQVDFMTATSEESSFQTGATPGVTMSFKHQLTAVRFVLGDMFPGGYIKNIGISGIYRKGTYTIGSGWTLSDADKSAVAISYETGSRLDKQVEGTASEDVTGEGETFLLIPQEFAADDEAVISITYYDGYDDYRVTASLAGQDAWVAGTTVTYAISSEKLKTLRISEIAFPETVSGAPKTGWNAKTDTQDGDCVGMYVVKDGINFEAANVKCEYLGGTGRWKWKIHHPVVDGVEKTLYHKEGYTYYFYYPYREGTPSGYPTQGHSKGETAENFFSAVISAYSTEADQSSTTKFNAADLQVAKGEDADYASTVTASMERQVGLARLQFPEKSISTTITYLNGSQSGTSGTTDVTASKAFEGNAACPNGDTYYFYTKANDPTMFNVSTGVNAWKNSVNVTLGKAETSDVQMVYGRRYNWTSVNAIWNYTCQKKEATFTGYQETGETSYTYKLQVWGAQGGGSTTNVLYGSHAGRGGYSYGNYTKEPSATLHIFVGGQGTICYSGTTQLSSAREAGGGYNGGGHAYHYAACGPWPCYGGGGMTHISTTSNPAPASKNNPTAWSPTGTLIVAGGGGGADNYTENEPLWNNDDGSGGYGGGDTAERGHSVMVYNDYAASTQTSGYRQGIGQSASASYKSSRGNANELGGGGGGWWGGYAADCGNAGGNGGSGYIGGVATPKATINGGTSFEAPGGGNETGHLGDGYARITLTRE